MKLRAFLGLSSIFFLPVAVIGDAAQARIDLGIDLAPKAVVNGERVQKGDPVTISTVAIDIGGGLCTGSLIAKDVVVTAAHCVKGRGMRVIFGTSGRGPSVGVRDTASRGSPGRGAVRARDIALLYLAGPVPGGYAPVKVLSNSSSLRKGQRVVVAGFGRTGDGPSGGMHKGTISIVRQTEAEVVLTSSETGNSGQGLCQGDSGGPAFVEKNDGSLRLFGIVSRGDGECRHEGIVGRLDAHRKWVDATIRGFRSGRRGGPEDPEEGRRGAGPRDEDEEEGPPPRRGPRGPRHEEPEDEEGGVEEEDEEAGPPRRGGGRRPFPPGRGGSREEDDDEGPGDEPMP
jgi:V8-like Glu-specific endopeptidase